MVFAGRWPVVVVFPLAEDGITETIMQGRQKERQALRRMLRTKLGPGKNKEKIDEEVVIDIG